MLLAVQMSDVLLPSHRKISIKVLLFVKELKDVGVEMDNPFLSLTKHGTGAIFWDFSIRNLYNRLGSMIRNYLIAAMQIHLLRYQ